MSSSVATTSATAAATTTYPFTYTTYTNASPSPFTKPAEFPSIFSFGSAISCTATASASASASAQPSGVPLEKPRGTDAACVISNAAAVNDHAFWDLYACCKSGNMTAFGAGTLASGDTLCTAQCTTGDDQTWQELGECLNKRVEAVVCKPKSEEIGNGTAGASPTRSGAPSAAGSSVVSTGAASTVQSSSSKAGLLVFGLLALGSAAGMLL